MFTIQNKFGNYFEKKNFISVQHNTNCVALCWVPNLKAERGIETKILESLPSSRPLVTCVALVLHSAGELISRRSVELRSKSWNHKKVADKLV